MATGARISCASTSSRNRTEAVRRLHLAVGQLGLRFRVSSYRIPRIPRLSRTGAVSRLSRRGAPSGGPRRHSARSRRGDRHRLALRMTSAPLRMRDLVHRFGSVAAAVLLAARGPSRHAARVSPSELCARNDAVGSLRSAVWFAIHGLRLSAAGSTANNRQLQTANQTADCELQTAYFCCVLAVLFASSALNTSIAFSSCASRPLMKSDGVLST